MAAWNAPKKKLFRRLNKWSGAAAIVDFLVWIFDFVCRSGGEVRGTKEPSVHREGQLQRVLVHVAIRTDYIIILITQKNENDTELISHPLNI